MLENMNYYRVFFEVARSGSISRAAEKLFISQPAVSKSISNLESALGITLMKRSSRGIELNDEGRLLYERLSSAFDTISRTEDELARINELGIGELKIGVSTSLCRHILLSYLKDFIANNPHVKIEIDCHSTFNTIRQLQEGNIDIGMICETKLPTEYIYVPLTEVHDIFVASEAYLSNLSVRESADATTPNPWLVAGNVTGFMTEAQINSTAALTSSDISNHKKDPGGMNIVEILEKSNLMLLEKQNITRMHIDRYMYDNDINPGQILEINNMDLLIDFAAIGMGISAVVKEFAEDSLQNESIIELPLTNPIPPRTVGFIYKRGLDSLSPAGAFLEDFLK